MQLTRLVSPYVQLLSALRSLPWELDSEVSYMWGCQDGTSLTAVLSPCEHRHSFVPGPWPTLLISEMGARDLSPETQSRTHSSSRPGLPGWPRGWGEHSRGAFGGPILQEPLRPLVPPQLQETRQAGQASRCCAVPTVLVSLPASCACSA